jgi:hypothetical protein
MTFLGGNAQENIIQGYVYDFDTHEVLPYANVCIKNSQMGTITNSEGYFKYKIPAGMNSSITIEISFIGYKSKTIKIQGKGKHDIYLKKDAQKIPEVVVKENFILTTLKKAFNRIDKNYPSEGSRCKGFLRQTVSKKDTIKYMGEAFMDFYKSSYQKNCKDNQINIFKFRKFTGSNGYEDSLVLKGAPFLTYSLDYVKLMPAFLNPQKAKEYNYQYTGITTFQNTEHYQILFEKKDGNYSGKLLINKKNHAITHISTKYSGEPIIENRYRKGPATSSVTYSNFDGKYYLKKFNYKIYFTNRKTNEKLLTDAHYTATNIKLVNAKPIDYKETIAYNDVFMDETVDTNNNFWRKYNIIEQDKQTQQFINQSTAQSNETRLINKILKYLLEFKFGAGISHHSASTDHFPGTITAYQTDNKTGFSSIVYDKKPVIYNYFTVSYQFSKVSAFSYYNYKKWFLEEKHEIHSFQYHHRKRIKHFGRPIFIDGGIGFSFYKHKLKPDLAKDSNNFTDLTMEYAKAKGINSDISLALVMFPHKSMAIKFSCNLSVALTNSSNINYTKEVSGIQYETKKNQNLGFTGRLKPAFSIGLNYYLSSDL